MVTKYKSSLLIALSLLLSDNIVLAQNQSIEKIKLHWQPSAHYNGQDDMRLKLVLKNTSAQDISLKNWNLWFNAMFPVLEKKTAQFEIYNRNGNLFELSFLNQVLKKGDSLVVDYETKFPIVNNSTVPNGFYFKNNKEVVAVKDVTYDYLKKGVAEQNEFNANLFDKNDKLNINTERSYIFPTPKSLQLDKGSFKLDKNTTFFIDESFEGNLDALHRTTFLKDLVKSNTEAKLKILKIDGLTDEAYHLTIANEGIKIESSSAAGVFYALQSIASMHNEELDLQNSGVLLQALFAKDEPRYAYRGFMLDIARNFRSKEVVMKYLDWMAKYKLNVFHFHFIDDEGWRIEIPSLPELTEVGSKRSPYFADGNSLQPAYGSGAVNTKRLYLTKSDFIEILKYAKDRHIKVVPELETPGHARAAVRAMETRYNRLMAAGKESEAKEFLLHDLDDQSIYNSAQNWNDNVMNPALESSYTFVTRILDEFQSMYQEAGVKFDKVSLGGDEVPNGVWEKSPQIQKLMKEKGFKSVYEVWTYYIARVNEICLAKGLEMAGWEEIGMVNEGKGMVVNPKASNKENMQVDVWNNVIGGGQEDLVYRLANAGYKTVFISASNTYFDMMWNTNFSEPGLKWATYADLYHSYSLLPEDFFANIDTYYSGKAKGKEGFKDKVRLTEFGKSNLIGIKGGLWAETVLEDEQLDYLVFPRFFVLAEKAWSAKRAYESESNFSVESFEQDYSKFVQRIANRDLPRISKEIHYRLPAVGVKEEGGNVFANLEYGQYDIYYTVDGSTPTVNSLKYNSNKPLKARVGQKLAFAVINKEGRVGQISYFVK